MATEKQLAHIQKMNQIRAVNKVARDLDKLQPTLVSFALHKQNAAWGYTIVKSKGKNVLSTEVGDVALSKWMMIDLIKGMMEQCDQ